MSVLRIGTPVLISIKPNEITMTREMKKFNGKIFPISNVKTIKIFKTSGESRMDYYYNLKDVNSKKGLPFSFTRDMIHPVYEEDNDVK
jgi:hypothetical protein